MFVVLSVWKFSYLLAVISASVVILTAGYILWAVQRVYLGAEYKGPHEEALVPINLRELIVAATLFVLAIWFGVYPNTVLRYMDSTIDQQVIELTEWTRDVKAVEEEAATEAVETAKDRDAPGLHDRVEIKHGEGTSAAEWTELSVHTNSVKEDLHAFWIGP